MREYRLAESGKWPKQCGFSTESAIQPGAWAISNAGHDHGKTIHCRTARVATDSRNPGTGDFPSSGSHHEW